MCGNVTAAAGKSIVSDLVARLKKLEFRGYYSACFAVIDSGAIERLRSAGRVAELEVASTSTIVTIEKGKRLKVACLEEIAFCRRWITPGQLDALVRLLTKNSCGQYLFSFLRNL